MCFFRDILQLYHLIGMEPSSEKKECWENKYNNNEWIEIYNKEIFPIFDAFVCIKKILIYIFFIFYFIFLTNK